MKVRRGRKLVDEAGPPQVRASADQSNFCLSANGHATPEQKAKKATKMPKSIKQPNCGRDGSRSIALSHSVCAT